MAKGPNERCTIGHSGSMQKTRSSSVDKFLPGLAAQGVLEIGDTFPVTISEQFPEDGVICNAQRASLISIRNVNVLNAICQDWQAMRLDEAQQYHVF